MADAIEVPKAYDFILVQPQEIQVSGQFPKKKSSIMIGKLIVALVVNTRV